MESGPDEQRVSGHEACGTDQAVAVGGAQCVEQLVDAGRLQQLQRLALLLPARAPQVALHADRHHRHRAARRLAVVVGAHAQLQTTRNNQECERRRRAFHASSTQRHDQRGCTMWVSERTHRVGQGRALLEVSGHRDLTFLRPDAPLQQVLGYFISGVKCVKIKKRCDDFDIVVNEKFMNSLNFQTSPPSKLFLFFSQFVLYFLESLD